MLKTPQTTNVEYAMNLKIEGTPQVARLEAEMAEAKRFEEEEREYSPPSTLPSLPLSIPPSLPPSPLPSLPSRTRKPTPLILDTKP